MITERIRKIVIEAVESRQLDPSYEFSEEELLAIRMLLVKQQLETPKWSSAHIEQKVPPQPIY